MSSKSKFQKKSGSKPPAGGRGEGLSEDLSAPEPSQEDFGKKVEEVLDVPKDTSPFRFLLVIAFIVLLTVIFAVDPSMMASVGRGPDEAFVTWEHPTEGPQELTYAAFIGEKRLLDDVYRALVGRGATDEDAARFVVLDALAVEAGIAVTDNELREFLLEIANQIGGAEALKGYMATQTTGGIVGFEATTRRFLRAERYASLMAWFGGQARVADVFESWRDQHLEYAFDWAAIEVASLEEDARAELPDDATLEAWMAELDEDAKADLMEPVRIRAELAGYRIGGDNDAAGLLAAYPEPAPEPAPDESTDGSTEGTPDENAETAPEETADETADESTDESTDETAATTEDEADDAASDAAPADPARDLAKRYYDRVYFSRFLRPEPAEGEEPLGLADRFLPFEDVEAQARVEAPVYFAAERWLNDLSTRAAAGEEIDLAAEADALGLSYRPADEALSVEEWSELEDWGSAALGARVSRLETGALTPILIVDDGAISVARQVEKIASYLPEFTEIRDQVADAWVEQRAGELALERLAAVREGFTSDGAEPAEGEEAEDDASEPVIVDEAAFAEAVAALGLEVGRRPAMERSEAFGRDPNQDDPAHSFLRSRNQLYSLEEGAVAEPALDSAGETAYLVRVASKQPAPDSEMSPFEYRMNRAMASGTSGIMEASFSYEALSERYGLALAREDSSESEE